MYTIEEIMFIVERISKNYNEIERVYLFGSYARGNATEHSDIDLRIDVDPSIGLKIGGFYMDLRENFNSNIDIVTTRQLSPYFLKEINKEEKLMYGKQ